MHQPTLLISALWFVATTACGGASTDVDTSPGIPVDTAASRPPELRLSGVVRPTLYEIQLTLLPGAETFSGTVQIDVELEQAVDVLWLHGKDLTVGRSTVSAGGPEIAAKVVRHGDEVIGFRLAEPVGPGAARLSVAYSGKLSDEESRGLFRRKEGDDWYIYTQFESTYARQAFPAFDEPIYKVPFHVALTIKTEHLAFSNTPIESQSDLGNGMKTVSFKRTKPLPSYLVAMAVGPFEVVDAGTAGKANTKIRIITPRGKAGEAAYAAASTGPILELLEQYFGGPYPYEKLDQIAVPGFGGAMENPGLVTYGLGLLLRAPDEDTIWRKRAFAGTCAHELAHMWFGDLVTMEWWNDIWLNESFATWMGGKIVHQWKPEWDGDVSRVRRRAGAMGSDSLDSSRKIRQPIESATDIRDAFDGITYSKGGTVLAMFESWLGEDKFRDAVRAYITEHAGGNATAEHFLAALGRFGGKDVVDAFATFIDQSGVPSVSVSMRCDAGKKPTVSLSQTRYRPAGSKADTKRLWRIPVCVEYDSKGKRGRDCILLTEKTADLELSTSVCPNWINANDSMSGYYRVEYSKPLRSSLLAASAKHLTVAERVGVIYDLRALISAGKLATADALALVPGMLKDGNRHIISASVGIAAGIGDHLVADEVRPNYRRFINKVYRKRARELGWKAGADENEDTRLLRPSLLWLVADEGHDAVLIAQAKSLALAWLDDRKAIDADMISTVLGVAAKNSGAALWKRLYEQAKTTKDSKERRRLLGAMSSFVERAVVDRNLAIVLGDDFTTRESTSLMWGALSDPSNRKYAFGWIKDNFDKLVAHFPKAYAEYLPYTGGGFCAREAAKEVEEFFRPRLESLAASPRRLDQVIERIHLCATRRENQLPSVTQFLKNY